MQGKKGRNKKGNKRRNKITVFTKVIETKLTILPGTAKLPRIGKENRERNLLRVK